MASTLKDKVEFILSTVPESRNSDITLTIELWRHYYGDLLFQDGNCVMLKELWNLPREDHLKRYRAQLQNVELKYLPTDITILVERAKLSGDWKRRLGYNSITQWDDETWLRSIQEFIDERSRPTLF